MRGEDNQSEYQLFRTRGRNAPILTDLAACDYGISRGAEPYRGFPQFVAASRATIVWRYSAEDIYARKERMFAGV